VSDIGQFVSRQRTQSLFDFCERHARKLAHAPLHSNPHFSR
jgi:hypothetical protein